MPLNSQSLTTITQIPAAPPRPADGHKGTFGTVIVVGGCQTMIGAPAICATAALRAGAGLVKIATEQAVLPFALMIEPGATGIVTGEDGGASEAAIEAADPFAKAVVAAGPGLGKSDGARDLMGRLHRGRRSIVLDADGLNLLAETGAARPENGPPMVMTPHPGEFARLAQAVGVLASPTDPESRPAAAAALACVHRAVVVLKGPSTIVSDGPRIYTNTTGNVALATAGSGDILTGLIAALWAQGLSGFDAAVLGVYLHGMAADLWTAARGPSGLTSRDLAALIPNAFARRRGAK